MGKDRFVNLCASLAALVLCGSPARAEEKAEQILKASHDYVAGRSVEIEQTVEQTSALLMDGKPAGLLGVADSIKPSTPAALAALRAEGLRVVMLTGDHRTSAEVVAKKLGITPPEFAAIMAAAKKRYGDYPNLQNHWAFSRGLDLYRFLKHRLNWLN